MLGAYFFILSNRPQVEYKWLLIKVDWLAACIVRTIIGAILAAFLGVGKKFAQSSSQWEAKADTVPEKRSQTLLAN
jgi:hypothetical protein